MRTIKLLLALAVLALPAWAALDYERLEQPEGDFAFSYPTGWAPTYGFNAVGLQPPGPDGESLQVTLERCPLGDTPPTAGAFVSALLKEKGRFRRLASRRSLTVAGTSAERIALDDTKSLRGLRGETLPGPMRHVYLVIPRKAGYYVLSMKGPAPGFNRNLPEFDRIAASLTLR